jgi:hypothetical protein
MMAMMMISSLALGANGDIDDNGWTAKLTSWSTEDLPSVTFSDLEKEEIQIAAGILSKDLGALIGFSDANVDALTESTAQCLFEVACLKPDKTGLPFDVRDALVKIAERKTSELAFEDWADVLDGVGGKEDEELVYSAKAAQQGHEESLQFLHGILEDEDASKDKKERVQALIAEYDLPSPDDGEDDGDE